jgi:hypothetical protein
VRRLLGLLLALGLTVAFLGAHPGPGGALPARHATAAQAGDPADDPDGDASTDDAPVPGGDIIPQPNSGREPTEAGDRGGALQGLVFVAILAGVGTIVGLAVRESRRARRGRPAADAP